MSTSEPTEEFDIEDRASLERYLAASGRPWDAEYLVDHKVLAGGVSGRTVLAKFQFGQPWVLKQALPKLRVEADWFSDPRRIHREAAGLKWVGNLTNGPSFAPRLIFDDERHHIIAMEAVPEPHENWKSMLLAGRVELAHAATFGHSLGIIHWLSHLAGADQLAEFADRSFFESLRIEPYYEFSSKQDPRAAPFYEALISDTQVVQTALVHGDYSPKNVLVHNDRLVLLDFEVAHWGDPTFDVGFALTHFLSKAHHVATHRLRLFDAASTFNEGYSGCLARLAKTDRNLESRSVRHALGCLLARVVGRSPLEYLTPQERERQREIVVRLMQDPPQTVPELIERFGKELDAEEH